MLNDPLTNDSREAPEHGIGGDQFPRCAAALKSDESKYVYGLGDGVTPGAESASGSIQDIRLNRAESIRVMHPLFQEGQGGSTPTSALQLQFGRCDLKTAIALNRTWHSRLPRLIESNITRTTHHVCYAANWDGAYYAVAVWSSPVSQSLPQGEWIELRRFAVANDAPKFTASRMLGWMVRDIRRSFPRIKRLISYQDCETHKGTIYRAVGWIATVQNKDRRQAFVRRRNGECRNTELTTSLKQRWEKSLTPTVPHA